MVTMESLNQEKENRQAFIIDLFDNFDNCLTVTVSLINSYELANEDFPLPDKIYRLIFEDYVSYQVHNRNNLEVTSESSDIIYEVGDEVRRDVLISLIGEEAEDLSVYELKLENHFLEVVSPVAPTIEEIEMEFEPEKELLN